MSDEHTLVIYRRWRDTGSLVALFPAEPSDINGWYCLSYERVGQHSGADYFLCIQATMPASPNDAALLAEELARIGYILKPIKRASYKVHEARRAMAKSLR